MSVWRPCLRWPRAGPRLPDFRASEETSESSRLFTSPVRAGGGGRLSEGLCSDEPPARSRPSPSALHGPGCLPQAHLPAGARTQKGRCCRLARMRPLGSSESETGRGRGRGECFTGRFRLGKVLSRLLGTDGGDRRVLGASGLGVRGLDGTATAGISTGKGHSCPPPAPV